MLKSIRLLSGGAAQGLVKQLQDRYAQESGHAIRGTFGAVGAMRDKLLAGEPCDVLILTQAIIDQLTRDGHLVPGSAVPLGAVKTGIAVKAGQPQPNVATAAALKQALRGAHEIYFPDPINATAGIHFMKVMKTLGVADELASRFRPFPNGAAAMREMAHATSNAVIGCTQVTEILFADGVDLAGLLPQEFELATVYTGAVCTKAQEPQAGAALLRVLGGGEAASARKACGFEAA
jgi:molybdate transport system substrate-binding protein